MQPSARVDPSYDDFMHSMLTTEKTVIPNPISLPATCSTKFPPSPKWPEPIKDKSMSKRAGLVLELATHITTLLPKIFFITTRMILRTPDVDMGIPGDFDDLRTLQGDIEELMKIVEDEALLREEREARNRADTAKDEKETQLSK